MTLAMQSKPLPDIKYVLMTLLHAQRSGKSCLPQQMGLNPQEFSTYLHFLGKTDMALSVVSDKDEIRAELLALRQDEYAELTALLMQHRYSKDSANSWLAKIVAAGCLGSEHLWRDLGLSDRQSLTHLFEQHFPALAQRNYQNMRWKKFLYKQLCEAGGHYVCRSPSCETCPSYDDCFGEEI